MEPSKRFLPYGRHAVDDDDVAAVVAVLRGDWLTTGPTVEAFEAAFADKVGARFAVSCSSGTAGLHLATLALEFGADDDIVVPSMTFLATANAARYVGAEVTFADVDEDSGLLGVDHLRAALARAGNRARGVIPVHLNGQTVDMEAVASIAAERGLRVIEDACHVLGARTRTGDGAMAPVGSCRYSDMAVFSLHPVKTVTMGEGGVVTTNDEALYRRLARLRNHGMVRDADAFENTENAFDADGDANPWYYEMPEIGFNYRASGIHCALGLSQLDKLERLARLAPLVRPIDRIADCEAAWHLCPVLIDFEAAGTTRRVVMRVLEAAGIGSQVHYYPVHRQPYYRKRFGDLDLPGADAYYARVLSLPLFPAMELIDVDRVIDALGTALFDQPRIQVTFWWCGAIADHRVLPSRYH